MEFRLSITSDKSLEQEIMSQRQYLGAVELAKFKKIKNKNPRIPRCNLIFYGNEDIEYKAVYFSINWEKLMCGY